MLTLAAINLIGLEKIVQFVLMLSVLVVLHELGHFAVARRNGVKVNEFAVGMGPKLLGWTSPRSGTLYSLRALPIGGYCAMEGEDNKTSEAEQQREFLEAKTRESRDMEVRHFREGRPGDSSVNFQAKTPWQRLAIVLAGPVANFILCYVILLVSAIAFGVQSSHAQPIVGQLVAGSPAQHAGIRAGDRIVELNRAPVTSGQQLIDSIHKSLGKPLELAYVRDGVRSVVNVTPAACPPSQPNQGCIGFLPVPAYERVGLGEAVTASFTEFGLIADATAGSVGMLVMHFTQYAPQVSGVIGMGQAASTIQDFGWGPYFWLAATISFALGLFNLLPVPALDGGRAAFIVAELVRGKPVDPEKEAMVHIAGFAALMALMLLVAFHDIARIVSGNGVL
ncbi:MAG: site-2 protease family protein [Candidatus Eremiobacteraeota bacterium]|nr:site-2 protease family protein [Candidatus Eremiobacteraeota bacterium]